MRRVLGLDLGTTSIGWALVDEATSENETSKIIKLGVRVNPLTTEEKDDFEKGKPLSLNADRTLKRGARRNLQRFKQRRENLIEVLLKSKIITEETILTETGENSTYQTIKLRAKAARERIEKEELARVFLAINKKRGYKSSRKTNSDEEGMLIDGMEVAKELYDKRLTPGQYVYNTLQKGKKYIPDFYRSDLRNEFDKIWGVQKQFYPNILTEQLYEALKDKNKKQTWAICKEPFNIVGIKEKGTASEKKLERYRLRATALNTKLDLEHLAIVLQEINNDINKSSGYLGEISDRSKILYFNKITVGEYLWKQIKDNPHTRLKGQVFYRQDYLDEFEQIWETQKKYHPELTDKLKEDIRDVIVFYQRKLKSQKGLISLCEFEKRKIEVLQDGKVKIKEIGPRVVPKSSPLFQEFKIWQNLNNLVFENEETRETVSFTELDEELREDVFLELNIRGNLDIKTITKIIFKSPKSWKANFKEIQGNQTNQELFKVYQKIAEYEGYGFDWNKKNAHQIIEELTHVFKELGISPNILVFDFEKDLNSQQSYQLWHLLYSAEDDPLKIDEKDILLYGKNNVSIKKTLHKKFGFKPEYASLLANVSFKQDYGNLSAKAIKKILPELKNGHEFSKACALVGYNHSHSLTKEENQNRVLKNKLELVKKNSLRNPVVEKILNQMVNVVNQIIDVYGKPDEIRVELARELKKSASERASMTKQINDAYRKHLEIKEILKKDFNIANPTRNDVIKYKLYQELAKNGYKTIYTNQYIPKELLFSKEIDIEHIIPKAKLFDDSFSNKTLSFRNINQEKGNQTAIDYIENKYSNSLEDYVARVETLFKEGAISKSKYRKLLTREKDIPEDFIERDLRNSQYIAKKAKEMLHEVFREVNTTTGSITSTLREDWGLTNIMKELNLPKYRALGLTTTEVRKNGNTVEQIVDWSKRNDHRHHAVDALVVAFTTHNHVQYLNNLNASNNKESKLYAIKNKITKKYPDYNGNLKRKFIPPMDNFREAAKKHLEEILVSHKAKNKVVTKNINITKKKGKDQHNKKIQLTPRGQLHKETVYGKILTPIVKEEKVNAKFNETVINQVCNPKYKEALLKRLNEFNNDPKKAFTGKNSLTKNPIPIQNGKSVVPEKVKIKYFEDTYTIRKEVSADLKIDKVVDEKVKKVLKKRLVDYNNNAKEAFSNLDKNPIWLNEDKGIAVKRVKIKGVSNAIALHEKRDHFGAIVNGHSQETIPTDYVSTGNNHHVAIYKDPDGNLHDNAVSFFEAVTRKVNGLAVVDKEYNKHLGWQFMFTLKQNEMFVFPGDGFEPSSIDLLDPKNYQLISKYLFRVQKFSKVDYGNTSVRDYVFRHHLETTINDQKELKEITYYSLKSTAMFNRIVKVRVNHIGQIVHVGEY